MKLICLVDLFTNQCPPAGRQPSHGLVQGCKLEGVEIGFFSYFSALFYETDEGKSMAAGI